MISVAGDLQLSKPVLERFRETHPELVSRFVYTQATAPELTGKLRAQQAAGRVNVDFVMTCNDSLAETSELLRGHVDRQVGRLQPRGGDSFCVFR